MVFYDKITQSALRVLDNFPVAPVIIKTRENKFDQVKEAILPFIPKIVDRVDHISAIFRPFRDMKEFSMISAILPREVVFDLAESREVEKIFGDKIMSIVSYPTVSKDGIFTIHSGIYGDTKKITSTYYTKKLVGCDVANMKGYSGEGVKVAVIDTGAAKTHPMLRYTICESVMITTKDGNGHGTWCCSCVFGRYSEDTRLTDRPIPCEGMAPRATGISIKALGHLIGTGSTSGILDAINIAYGRFSVDVISMSLGGKCEENRPEDDPYYHVFERIVDMGIIPVVAAGNSGPGENTISTPGCLPNVLTVGAYDPIVGEIARFSSRGPTNWGDIKPDCVAPGVNIHSATNGLLDKAGDNKINRYSPLSGTSMATPHIAGLVCLMKQAYVLNLGKNLTLYEIKRMLKELGHEKNNTDGYGPMTWSMFEHWMETEYGIKI